MDAFEGHTDPFHHLRAANNILRPLLNNHTLATSHPDEVAEYLDEAADHVVSRHQQYLYSPPFTYQK